MLHYSPSLLENLLHGAWLQPKDKGVLTNACLLHMCYNEGLSSYSDVEISAPVAFSPLLARNYIIYAFVRYRNYIEQATE